jgi:signal transduction histidine kinase
MTDSLHAFSARSLRWTLLAPMALVWAVLAVVAIVGLQWDAGRRLEQSLARRAELLANLVHYSAESAATPADVQRFVTKASAEADVVAIAVAAGQPARVLASSRDAWRGLLVSELPHGEIADDLAGAITHKASLRHFHPEMHRFDYSAPLRLGLPALTDGSLASGAVAIQLDTRPLPDELFRAAAWWMLAAIAGVTAFIVIGCEVLRRRVLGPLATIADAVHARCEDDDAAWASTQTGDELGALARTLRTSIQARARAIAALCFADRMAAVGTLAAGVAHEIHTPLQFVNDSVHFLRDASNDALETLADVRATAASVPADAPPDVLRVALAKVARAVEGADIDYLLERLPSAAERSVEGIARVEAVIRALKASAEASSGDLRAEDVNQAVEDAVTAVATDCLSTPLLGVECDPLPPVVCRVGDVQEAVLQLLTNAVEAVARRHGAGPPGALPAGRIAVRTARDGADVLITVADNGAGIDPAIADRVFDPFFTTKEVGRGAGQGLAIAWRIVTEQHGGQLTFVSAPGTGTTFTLRLPIAGPAAAETQEFLAA